MEGKFREDLYYRLHVVSIQIPPLRERIEDLPLLAHKLLAQLVSSTGVVVKTIEEDAWETMKAYAWPGNVRELANVLERAAVLGDGPEITSEDLPLRIVASETENMPEGFSYRHAVDAARAEVIRKALAHTKGNRAAAARILGMHKTHLLNLMKSMRIE